MRRSFNSDDALFRQGLQQTAIAFDWLMNMQAPLNFPDARRDRLDDPNTKILFKRCNDTERVQVRR